MSVAVRDIRRTAWAGTEPAAVLVLGVVLLLARTSVLGARAPLALAAIYTALALMSVSVSVPTQDPAPLGMAFTLVVGLVAVALAGAIVGPRIPLAAGPVALGLNAAAAISEEAFFRRFVYGRLVGLSVPVAIVGSGLLFALVHVPAYGWVAFWVDLGAGLVLSWQRWASGSWTAPAATHVAANLMAVLR